MNIGLDRSDRYSEVFTIGYTLVNLCDTSDTQGSTRG